MASLSQMDLEILRVALEIWRADQSFERAVGSAVRKAGGDFQDYLRLMEALRERAKKAKGGVDQAAKALLSEQEK